MSNNINDVIMWAASAAVNENEPNNNNILVKVVNAAAVPVGAWCSVVGDLALCPVCVSGAVSAAASGAAASGGLSEIVRKWEYTPESALDRAKIKSDFLFNAVLTNTMRVLETGFKYDMIDDLADFQSCSSLCNYDIPVITTKFNADTFGSVAIFFPGICKAISEKFNDSFYIVFISSDYVILHKYGTISVNDIKARLIDTNNTFSDDNKTLTNNVYFYNKELDTIEMCKTEEYKRFECFVKDINHEDCENMLDLCYYYQISEKCLEYALNYIETGKLKNDHCYTKLVEELIKIENE